MINVDKLSTRPRYVNAHAKKMCTKIYFQKYLMLPFEERKQEECLLAAPRNSSGVQEVLVVIGGICNNKKLKEVDYYNSVKGQSF